VFCCIFLWLFHVVFGRLFVKRFTLCYRSVVLSVLTVVSVMLVHCGQMVGQIRMKLGVQVGLGPGHIVLDGTNLPLPQRGTATPNFQPISVVAKWLHRSRCHLVWRYASVNRYVATRPASSVNRCDSSAEWPPRSKYTRTQKIN